MWINVWVSLYLIVVLIILVTMAIGGILAAPWVPIKRKDVKRLLILGKIKPREVLLDLGCGDGRIIINASRHFGAQTIGYEIALLPYILCYFKILLYRQFHNVKLKFRNFYKQDFSKADIITAFLSPRAMEKLESKVLKELKPGARFISYVFKFPNWKPVLIDKPNPKDLAIYLYQR